MSKEVIERIEAQIKSVEDGEVFIHEVHSVMIAARDRIVYLESHAELLSGQSDKVSAIADIINGASE